MLWPNVGHFRPSRVAFALVLASAAYFILFELLPTIRWRRWELYGHAPFDLTAHLPHHSSTLGVDLVVASTAKDDTSWTDTLDGLVPNIRVRRYVSDFAGAQYQPAVFNTGREALVYFTYIRDYYDELPDVTIFTHSQEHQWHVDAPLRQSMPFALAHLDLEQVKRRGYFNLRVSWGGACPAWINTTKVPEESHVEEESYMAEAFRANFGSEVVVPEILAGPCCSQFAVSREVIHRRSKEQYQRHIDWLVDISDKWGDSLTGRTWEHMWPVLFLDKSKDCPVEKDSLCRMYHICFPNSSALQDYQKLWDERSDLKEPLATIGSFLKLVAGSQKARLAKQRMAELQLELDQRLEDALARGSDEKIRQDTTLNLDW